MKRFASIILAAALFFAVAAVPVSAADFKLTDSTPSDGYEKVEAKNVMVKLFFNEDVSSEKTQKANKGKIAIENGDGKKLDGVKVLYDSKDSKKISLLLTDDLKQKQNYKVIVDGSLVSDSGDKLGKEATVTFSTRKADTGLGYMVLMFLMIVVMMVMTFRDQKKAMEAGSVDPLASINTNPYKLAKEKNISVQEAVKIIEAEKEKAMKKMEKMNRAAKEKAKKEEDVDDKVYRVKTKRIVKRK